jgi:hypothetical protein
MGPTGLVTGFPLPLYINLNPTDVGRHYILFFFVPQQPNWDPGRFTLEVHSSHSIRHTQTNIQAAGRNPLDE